MQVSVYVYYQVLDAAQALPLVQVLLNAVAEQTGIHGRLLCRQQQTDTWMEIYEAVSDLPQLQQQLAAQLAQLPWADCCATRHEEVFIDMLPMSPLRPA